jgi:GTP-binding protein
LDATQAIADQDLKIAGIIKEAGKACLILVNKWDLVTKDSKTVEAYEAQIRKELEFLSFAPLLFVSAKTGQRVNKVTEMINLVMNNYLYRISTGRLNQLIADAVMMHNPPSYKGRTFKIYYATQIKVKPPTIMLAVTDPEGLAESYRRYLENKLREQFGFTGTPIKFQLKGK